MSKNTRSPFLRRPLSGTAVVAFALAAAFQAGTDALGGAVEIDTLSSANTMPNTLGGKAE